MMSETNQENRPYTCGERGTSFNLWRDILGSPKNVVAPMVDQSEAAWRMLSRAYGAELCYTPMFHANVFVKDARYRKECLTTYEEDTPLIVQFCCNNVATLVEAGRYCQQKFAALDLNLGCPQAIARRGHYGAYLQDDWQLIHAMVNAVHTQLSIPITCKIRVFEDVSKTVRYARMLESAGCQMLTVHGRTREARGPLTGLADWHQITAVCRAVALPVVANGNIQYGRDVQACLHATGAVAVMSAEGNLHNPALFTGQHPTVWRICKHYLRLVEQYPCPLSYARGHLFKIMHYCLLMPSNSDIRQLIARANNFQQLNEAVDMVRRRYRQYVTDSNYADDGHDDDNDGDVEPWRPNEQDAAVVAKLPFPPFLCQPHEREPIADHLRKLQVNQELQKQQRLSGACDDSGDVRQRGSCGVSRRHNTTMLSKRKQKKLARGLRLGVNRLLLEKCTLCGNPRGVRCEHKLCRLHCRVQCYDNNQDCIGHRILCRTKRERAKLHQRSMTADVCNGGELVFGAVLETKSPVTDEASEVSSMGDQSGAQVDISRISSAFNEDNGC